MLPICRYLLTLLTQGDIKFVQRLAIGYNYTDLLFCHFPINLTSITIQLPFLIRISEHFLYVATLNVQMLDCERVNVMLFPIRLR